VTRGLASAAIVMVVYAACASAQRSESPRSGLTFASPEIRAMQADDVANPGMLWVERGSRLWQAEPDGAAKSCAGCHGDAATAMRGVAARYPAWDAGTAAVLDLEARINSCRERRQERPALPRESDELLALTAFVAHQSRGMPVAVHIDGPASAAFERGRALYRTRVGQMNLACTQCHDDNAGKRLLAETISQGQPNGYPAYRLEWQLLGSLQRRIRACFFGVRAEMPAPGAPELTDLELYLAWRAQPLPVETPAVRR